jgi:hypothetical protein
MITTTDTIIITIAIITITIITIITIAIINISSECAQIRPESLGNRQ